MPEGRRFSPGFCRDLKTATLPSGRRERRRAALGFYTDRFGLAASGRAPKKICEGRGRVIVYEGCPVRFSELTPIEGPFRGFRLWRNDVMFAEKVRLSGTG